MSYAARRQSSPRRLAGLAAVAALHAAAVYALVNGLGHQAVEILRAPLETKIVAELVKPPEPPKVEPPPPQPKVVKPPPPAYVPPPKVRAPAPPPLAAITAVTEVAPTAPPPPPVVAPAPMEAPAKVAPALDQGKRCPPPQYPAAARRAGESGAVVLRFLIDVDGSVVDSVIDASSGFERLDEAARAALAACRFTPGTTNGVPDRSWARIRYVWKLQ